MGFFKTDFLIGKIKLVDKSLLDAAVEKKSSLEKSRRDDGLKILPSNPVGPG